SIVRGLVIHSFQAPNGDFYSGGHAIELKGQGVNVVEGNFLGTDVTGTSGQPNEFADVFIYLSSDNLIGGTTPAARNVVSNILIDGYNVDTGQVDDNAGGNRVEGNYIGTDMTGTVAILQPNGAGGVTIDNMASNTIGGTDPGAGNVIVGSLGI